MSSSMSKYHDDDDCDCKKEKKDCQTTLKCGCSGGPITVPATTPTTPVVLATVPVNISKCCDPCALIEYASTVSVVPPPLGNVIGSTTFTVTIFKNCSDNFRISIGSYTHTQTVGDTGEETIPSINAFSFFVCDCDTCSKECCYYSAEITSSVVGIATATVNATLAVLLGSSGCHC